VSPLPPSASISDLPPSAEPSLFALECVSLRGLQYKGPGLPPLPSSSTSSNSLTSNFSPLTLASEATVVSEHGPDAHERTPYYNGITGDGDCPELVYRSNALTASFPKPVGRFGQVPVKSIHGVFDTPLNKVWDIVGSRIRDIIKAHGIEWSTIDMTPVVVWIGVRPGSTSANTAHDVSKQILALLQNHRVEGVVVEWRETVVQRLAGPPLLRPTHSPLSSIPTTGSFGSLPAL